MTTWEESNQFEPPEFNEFSMNSLMAFKSLKNKNIKNLTYSSDFKASKDVIEKDFSKELGFKPKYLKNELLDVRD